MHNPLGDFEHVFVGDDEITGCALAFTDQVATGIEFMGGVLVAFGVDAAVDVFGEFGRTEAVGELDAAEIIHHGVKHLGCAAFDESAEGVVLYDELSHTNTE